jgi:circadian clock protein KaiB
MSMRGTPTVQGRKVMLFVAGNEPNSVAAAANLRRLRESTPGCEIDFEIVDVLVHHPMALQRRVLVTPCLILVDPQPEVMIVGSLTDLDKVRLALRLPAEAHRDG